MTDLQDIAVDLVLAGALPPDLAAEGILPEGTGGIALSSRTRGALPPLVRHLRRKRSDLLISTLARFTPARAAAYPALAR